jgi:hypothetical protein
MDEQRASAGTRSAPSALLDFVGRAAATLCTFVVEGQLATTRQPERGHQAEPLVADLPGALGSLFRKAPTTVA